MLLFVSYTRQPLLPILGIFVMGILLLSVGTPGKTRAADAERMTELPNSNTTNPEQTPLYPKNAAPNALLGFLLEDKPFPLPPHLTPLQQEVACAILSEAEPRLIRLHTLLRQTLDELHNLSFDSGTPQDALPALGRKLIRLRTEIFSELRRISTQLEQQAGFNPDWGSKRAGAIHKPDECPICITEKLKEYTQKPLSTGNSPLRDAP